MRSRPRSPGLPADDPLTPVPPAPAPLPSTPARTAVAPDGTRLAVHDLGGDGPVALFAHATGFHGRVWAPVAAHLPGLHAWAPDLRGHGDSPLPGSGEPDGVVLSWDRFADDLLAVVDQVLGPLPAGGILGVGHSKGGAALLLAEQRRPGTFRALYLYEPVVFPPDLPPRDDDGENPLSAGALRRRAHFASYDEAEANFAAKPPFSILHPDALHAYVRHGFAPADDGVELKCRPTVEAEVYRNGIRHEAFAHLGAVACPVTVATGVDAPFTPAALAPLVASRLPAGRLVRHPDLGHFGPLQDPAAIAADIRTAFAS